MRIQSDAASLVLLARNKKADSPTLVVTVGLLYGNDHAIVEMAVAQPWLLERFGDESLDRGLKKTRGGFAIQGSAFPLTDGQAMGMAVRANMGPCSKTLHVHPPRRWEKTLVGYRAVVTGPLEPLPVTAANAFGGKGYGSNPQGMGHVCDGQDYDGVPLPAIETQTQGSTEPGRVSDWAGLMPLATQSDLRRRYLGTLDEQWKRQRAPFLPLDTDPRWFDEVAQDQCIDSYWQGTEQWAVAGMHPRQVEVSGRLPGFRPRLFVERKDRSERPISETPLDLDTVWLFPDAERVLLLYRAELPVIDLDAEDIAALGIGCETAAEGVRSQDEWVARLWPKPPVTPQPVQAPPPQPDPMPAMLATMQAALDARYKAFAETQKQVVESASAVASRFGQKVDASLIERQTPDLAAAVAAAAKAGPRPAFDAAALRANIELEIAQAKAAGQAHAERTAKTHGIDLQQAQARSDAAVQSKSIPSVTGMISKLDLPAAQKAQVMAQFKAGMAQIQATESAVSSRVGKVLATLAAMQPKMPSVKLSAPSIGWTRPLLEERHAAGDALSNERFVDLDLSGIDLTGGVMQKCVFERCNLAHARLTDSVLSECRFHDCDLSAADLQKAALNKAFVQRCRLDGVNAKAADLSNIQMLESHCAGADFSGAQMTKAHFVDCDFSKAIFSGAQMPLAVLQRCELNHVDMSHARLAKSQFDACTLNDARLPAAQLPGASWSRVEGEGVDLTGCTLCDWRLDQDCRLPGARLDGADLSNASLQGAVLTGASLRNATLDRALVSRCDLSESDGYRLTAVGTDFTGSNLSRAKWPGANLMESRLRKVCLEQTDLRASNLFSASTEGVTGRGTVLTDTLLNRCRLQEDLARV
ncbi:DUF2169 family type VI secretion system accessory protein [Pseudomonas sp. NPDC086278]|uniref:DUF2169 family type VI secretion system accessory protein n=1 Tax=Pseudomonas sp. NPDC086278 TaxID=3390646 RepID=UPI003D014D52